MDREEEIDKSITNVRQRHTPQSVLNTAVDYVKGNEGEKMVVMCLIEFEIE